VGASPAGSRTTGPLPLTGYIVAAAGDDPEADLSIAVTDGPDPVEAGTALVYTIDIHNAGPDGASRLKMSDTLPLGTTYIEAFKDGMAIIVNKKNKLTNLKLQQVSVGPQLGGETYSEMIIFRDDPALGRLMNNSFEFGATASATLLKAGAAADARFDENGTLCYILPKGGLMAGADLHGQKFQFYSNNGDINPKTWDKNNSTNIDNSNTNSSNSDTTIKQSDTTVHSDGTVDKDAEHKALEVATKAEDVKESEVGPAKHRE